MSLFHGAISDAIGRKPVIVAGMRVYALASAGAALSTSFAMLRGCRALQGACAGASLVVGRAIVRDSLQGTAAQQLMLRVMMIFGVAPMVGAQLLWLDGWHGISWPLSGFAVLMAIALVALRRGARLVRRKAACRSCRASWWRPIDAARKYHENPSALSVAQRTRGVAMGGHGFEERGSRRMLATPLFMGRINNLSFGRDWPFVSLLISSTVDFCGLFLFIASAPRIADPDLPQHPRTPRFPRYPSVGTRMAPASALASPSLRDTKPLSVRRRLPASLRSHVPGSREGDRAWKSEGTASGSDRVGMDRMGGEVLDRPQQRRGPQLRYPHVFHAGTPS